VLPAHPSDETLPNLYESTTTALHARRQMEWERECRNSSHCCRDSKEEVDHETFAIQLYERFTRGESVERLAAAFNIPVERIAVRLRAAERYIQQHGRKAA